MRQNIDLNNEVIDEALLVKPVSISIPKTIHPGLLSYIYIKKIGEINLSSVQS